MDNIPDEQDAGLEVWIVIVIVVLVLVALVVFVVAIIYYRRKGSSQRKWFGARAQSALTYVEGQGVGVETIFAPATKVAPTSTPSNRPERCSSTHSSCSNDVIKPTEIDMELNYAERPDTTPEHPTADSRDVTVEVPAAAAPFSASEEAATASPGSSSVQQSPPPPYPQSGDEGSPSQSPSSLPKAAAPSDAEAHTGPDSPDGAIRVAPQVEPDEIQDSAPSSAPAPDDVEEGHASLQSASTSDPNSAQAMLPTKRKRYAQGGTIRAAAPVPLPPESAEDKDHARVDLASDPGLVAAASAAAPPPLPQEQQDAKEPPPQPKRFPVADDVQEHAAPDSASGSVRAAVSSQSPQERLDEIQKRISALHERRARLSAGDAESDEDSNSEYGDALAEPVASPEDPKMKV